MKNHVEKLRYIHRNRVKRGLVTSPRSRIGQAIAIIKRACKEP
jgi:hypothetical protein